VHLHSGQRKKPLTSVLQIYKLPQSSLAELARNSVVQSGFEMEIKRHWLGQEWYIPGAAGNDINKVRAPDVSGAYFVVLIELDAMHHPTTDECPGHPAPVQVPNIAGRTGNDTREEDRWIG
jgi:hypothetical protein